MNDEVKTEEVVQTEELTSTESVYEAAAALYKEGKTDEAVQMIRDSLGDAEADEAAKVMAAADEINKVAETTETPAE